MEESWEPEFFDEAIAGSRNLWGYFQKQCNLSEEALRALPAFPPEYAAEYASVIYASARLQRADIAARIAQAFGVDVTAPSPRLLPGAQPLQGAEIVGEFHAQWMSYFCFNLTVSLIEEAVMPLPPAQRLAGTLQVCHHALREGFLTFHSALAQASPDAATRWTSVLSIAGHIRNNLKLSSKEGQRLRRVLEAEVGPSTTAQERYLRQILPGVILQALPEVDEAFSMNALKNKVVNIIESQIGPEQGSNHGRYSVAHYQGSPVPEAGEGASDSGDEGSDIYATCAADRVTPSASLTPEEEFELYETILEQQDQRQDEAAERHALWRAAGLSEQQYWVLHYSEQGEKQGVIAAKLKTTTAAVRVARHNARKKVRQYQRRHAADLPVTG